MITSSIGRGGAVLALVAGMIGVAASPAEACCLTKKDYVKIAASDWAGGKADFGTGGHHNGSPDGPGLLQWSESILNGQTIVTGRLTGRVYWDDLTSGGCARVRISMYNTAGKLSGSQNSTAACRAGGWTGSVPSAYVNISRGSTAAHKIVITTQKAASNTSAYYDAASATRYWTIN